MTDDNLFSDNADTIDPTKDYSAELIGEGKAYKDVQAAARALAEKEAFIQRLQNEQAQLRSDLNQRVTLEEFMDRMASNKDRIPPANQPDGDGSERNPPASSLDDAGIQSLIDDRLAAAREQDRRKANSAAVKRELEKAYGKGYLNTLKAKADELGLETQFLSDLAATHPKAFLDLVLPKSNQRGEDGGVAPPRTVVNSGGYNPNTNERGYSYYEKMRRENSKLYYTPKIQNEIHREAQRQGLSFLEN